MIGLLTSRESYDLAVRQLNSILAVRAFRPAEVTAAHERLIWSVLSFEQGTDVDVKSRLLVMQLAGRLVAFAKIMPLAKFNGVFTTSITVPGCRTVIGTPYEVGGPVLGDDGKAMDDDDPQTWERRWNRCSTGLHEHIHDNDAREEAIGIEDSNEAATALVFDTRYLIFDAYRAHYEGHAYGDACQADHWRGRPMRDPNSVGETLGSNYACGAAACEQATRQAARIQIEIMSGAVVSRSWTRIAPLLDRYFKHLQGT